MLYALLIPGYVCAAMDEQHVMETQEKERIATMSLESAGAATIGERERGAVTRPG